MKASNITRSIRAETKIAKTLFTMVSVFTISVLPSAMLNLWEFVDPSIDVIALENFSPKYDTFKRFRYIAFLVLFYNSLWNFFIYQRRDRDFRKSLEMLKKRVKSVFRIKDKCGFPHKTKSVQSNILLNSKVAATQFKTARNVSTVI